MKLKIKGIFLVLSGYQITWFFCIFGEYYNLPIIGLFIGIVYLTIFFYFIKERIKAFKICLTFSLIGYVFDTILSFSELFVINSNVVFGYLPIWFLALWPSFTTLFASVLFFLKNRPFLAFLMGATLAPSTYYLGIPLGIAKSENLLIAIIIMIIFWGLLLIYYS